MFGKKRTNSVRAATMLICYSIEADAWSHIISSFEFLKHYVELVAKRREERVKVLSKIAAQIIPGGDDSALRLAQERYVDEEDAQTDFILAQKERSATLQRTASSKVVPDDLSLEA